MSKNLSSLMLWNLRSGYRRSVWLALLVDQLGEPPTPWHPVVWMGNYLAWARRRWHLGNLPEGASYWAAGMLASYGVTKMLPRHWLLEGFLLKPLFALQALFTAVNEVEKALLSDNLSEARQLLAWHLVSRDTAELTSSEVAGATIESLAENLSDSVVAPLFFYRLGGLPLAAAYRFGNTADAMWGYRTKEFEQAGKVAARADDLLNVVPSRLTAMCILLAAGGRGWRIWASNRHQTTSPNAGHPISAIAGALGICLDKRGVYVINEKGRAPVVADIAKARHLIRKSLVVLLLLNAKL